MSRAAPVGADPAVAVRRATGAALVVLGSLIAAGILVGAVWSLVAPTVPCTFVTGGCAYDPFEGGRFFVAEGLFSVLAATCGVLAALVARRWIHELGWPVVVALAVGGLLASVVAWRVGVWLGPDDPNAGPNALGELAALPLRLRSTGLLPVWSIASLVVALWTTALSAGSAGVDPDGPRAAPDPDELAAWIQGQDQSRSTR